LVLIKYVQKHIFFGWIQHFWDGLAVIRFRTVWPSFVGLTVVHHPVDTFHVDIAIAFHVVVLISSYF
jgi:hypothetical protein